MATPAPPVGGGDAPALPRLPGRPWMVVLPLLALLLLLGAVGSLVWISAERESEERRQQQIADALWLRQSIQYQLDRTVDRVALLAHEAERELAAAAPTPTPAGGTPPPAGSVSTALGADLAAVLRTSSELAGIGVVDAEGRTLAWRWRDNAREPLREGTREIPTGFISAFTGTQRRELLQAAERIRRPFFTPVYTGPQGSAFDIVTAIVDDGRPAPRRFVVAIVSLERVLTDLAPWWLAQDNELTLSDGAGEIGARRAAGGPGRGEFVHQTSIDLADLQLILRTDRARSAQGAMANALHASIALLALLLTASLALLWRDARRRLAAEQRLREEHAFRTAIGDSVVTGLRARDPDGRVTYVNPAFCAMVGYGAHELIGQVAPWPYWAPASIAEHQERMQQRMRRIDAGSAIEPYETLFIRRDGTPLPVVIYESPLRDAAGRQTGWMSSIVDATERKQREEAERVQQERLQNAARLTTMGEIATSLAHELNQPLAAIRSYLTGSLNLLRAGATQSPVAPSAAGGTPADQPPDTLADTLTDTLGKADRQAQRAGEIIRRVHDFVRGRGPQRAALSLTRLLAEASPLFELQARKSGVRIVTEVAADVPEVIGDRVALEQVLLNLTRNAVEAMREAAPGSAVLTLTACRGADGEALISVADTGGGMTPEVQARLFEPFFTTKREGMGMGLNICRSLVESHGGRLLFASTAGTGTVFTVQLPAAPASAAVAVAA